MKIKLGIIFILLSLSVQAETAKEFVQQYRKLKNSKYKIEQKADSIFLHLYFGFNKFPKIEDSLRNDFLDYSLKKGNSFAIGKAYMTIGYFLFEKDDNSSAEFLKKSIAHLEKGKEGVDLCFAHQLLASTYSRLNKIEEAIKETMYGIKVAEKIGNAVLIANGYNEIGVLKNRQNKEQEALKYFLKAMNYYKVGKDNPGYFRMHTNAGNTYNRLKLYDSALFYLKKGLKDMDRSADSTTYAYFLSDLGATYLSLKNYEQAENYLLKAIKVRHQLGLTRELGYSYNYLGQVFLKKKQTENALSNFRKAISYGKLTNNPDLLVEAYKFHSETHALNKNFDSAYFFNKLYAHLNDSIKLSESNLAVEGIMAQFEFEKNESKINLLNEKNKIQELNIGKKNLYLLLAAVGLIAITIISLLFLRSRRLKLEKVKMEATLNEERILRENVEKIKADRIRISKELHDNIGSNLTFIKSSIRNQTNSDPQALTKLTDETIRELRKSVWLLNHEETTIEEWVLKLQEYFRFLPKVKVQFEQKNTTVITVHSSLLTQLFRVLQEAVNNAEKHAKCSEITLKIQQLNEQLKIAVNDNGIGFDSKQENFGFGLENMRSRIQSVNGLMKIRSEQGQGTQLTFTIQL